MTTTDRPKKRQDLQPLVEDWLRSRTEFLDVAGSALYRVAHSGAWHFLRLPLYLLRLFVYSPRGLGRVLRAVFNLVTDDELRPLRVEAVVDRDPSTAMTLRKERNERIHKRLTTGAAMASPVLLLALWAVSVDALAVVIGCVALWAILRMQMNLQGLAIGATAGLAAGIGLPYVVPPVPLPPTWVLWLGGVVLVEVLGWVGRPVGQKFLPAATVPGTKVEPLRAPFVMEALVNLGIRGMGDVEKIRLLFDVARVGPGFQVDLELPAGVPAAAVQEKRSQLSAALRRELGCVWPSVGSRHEGHLALYVSDQPMSTAKQAKWPLLKDGGVNLFRPAPAFTDQRGRWVDVTLAYTTWVIGAVPRMGKTFAVRELLLIAGLDPRAKVFAFDLKGTGDLSPCALYAHGYGVGADEEEEIAEQLAHMRWIRQELRRRAKVIRGLSHEECPENKVTTDLADRKDLNLGPIVVGVDECQMWFEEWPDKTVREEFITIARDLVKRGPALGIIPLFATQKPDAKSIPTAIADNASNRLCFKVNGQVSNDQVLGTSSYKSGLRATQFAFEDKGVAYFRGDGADALIVRTVAGLDAPASEQIALRARQARISAGLLSGFAADEVMNHEAEQVVFVDDVRQVFGAAQAMHLGDIRTGLAALRPGLYEDLDNAGLSALLRGSRVQVANVYVAGKPREDSSNKGVKREWLDVSTTETIGDAVLTEDDAQTPDSVVYLDEERQRGSRRSR